MDVDDEIELTIDRPAAGGRMIARHEGRIVLVSGAIPGERVRARVERVERRLAFAAVTRVTEPSPDRRATSIDPACGGCLYAHVSIDRQRLLKAAIVADAFARIGRHPLAEQVEVAASPEDGYRMRARLHVSNGRVGFLREGSHALCDARQTGQLLPAAIDAAQRIIEVLAGAGAAVRSIQLSENLAADQRALHVEVADPGRLTAATLESVLGSGIASVSVSSATGMRIAAGSGTISDPLEAFTGGRASGRLQRGAESFFQSNRFLVPELVAAVMEGTRPDGPVLDLYSGVGLFAITLAADGRSRITAVEGESSSGADLRLNAEPFTGALAAVVSPVEHYLSRLRLFPPTVIVDPPRTGLSRPVLDGLASRGGQRLVYVSCDPATLARDARGLMDGGYRLAAIRAFDLFPNTPHVEMVAVFER